MVKKKSTLKKNTAPEPSSLRLLQWIWQVAENRGLDNQALAHELGITPGYLSQIKHGFSGKIISREFAHSCAQFLNVPLIAVLIAAGQITYEDTIMPDTDMEHELEQAIKYILADKKWSPFAPRNIRQLDKDIQLFIVLLYQEACGRRLLPDQIDLKAIFKSLT